MEWLCPGDAKAVAAHAAAFILQAATDAIDEHGAFRLVLAGGTTPQQVYQLLAQASADWSHWHIYYGDERCLPADDAERNSHMSCRNTVAEHLSDAGRTGRRSSSSAVLGDHQRGTSV